MTEAELNIQYDAAYSSLISLGFSDKQADNGWNSLQMERDFPAELGTLTVWSRHWDTILIQWYQEGDNMIQIASVKSVDEMTVIVTKAIAYLTELAEFTSTANSRAPQQEQK